MIFDASSLINLANGGVLEGICNRLQPILIGPQVHGECESIKPQLNRLIESGAVSVLDDSSLPASLYLRLVSEHELGPGETECLAFALVSREIICCDDRRARSMIARELGAERVIGTIGLLLQQIRDNHLTVDAVLGIYEQMRVRGGFLPDLSRADIIKALG